ncbi:MAG: glycosyltransferase family 15 protein [Olpidium bornovanus]|uniref:Glycosyltransferase family 15 protein n=1 Tax=Olpidium bornovanus TaxID=278681 RepID=A0A8H7ZN44_9FUNG|nr:MAG: glycosyltransferase family 15 protein [Olpidium bornovanus]
MRFCECRFNSHSCPDLFVPIPAQFNRRFRYDWVFLNDEPFTVTDAFPISIPVYTSSLTKAKTKYGLIPREHWSYPSWIDQEKATAERARMQEAKVIYGGSLPYRHMCRFNSGFFFRHELLAEYEYYWRVEPGVKARSEEVLRVIRVFYCDVLEDPFVTLKKSGKMYGFTIALYEYANTIPTLWEATKEFMRNHPEHIVEGNSLDFISHDRGNTYNLCHFWSNFEIASLDFWRSKAYMDYFGRSEPAPPFCTAAFNTPLSRGDYLDQKGGFFYERWGDAPVHSIAAALLLKKDQIHFAMANTSQRCIQAGCFCGYVDAGFKGKFR